MESLYAEFLLWSYRIYSKERYQALLDSFYLRNENSGGILFELEECSSDMQKTAARFRHYWSLNKFNIDAFGEKGVVDWGAVLGDENFDVFAFAAQLAQALNNPPFAAFPEIVKRWMTGILWVLFQSDANSLPTCLKLCSHFYKHLPRDLKSQEPFCTFGKIEDELSMWCVDAETERRDFFKKAILGDME